MSRSVTRSTATAAAIGLAGVLLALQPGGAAGADGPAAGGSVPFSVADPATAPRPVVTVAIGGVPLLLLLDTGSTGIRVTSDKVPAGAVKVTGAAAPYGYGSGVRLHGDQADADVAVGGYHTGRLPIELVRSTDCFPDKPACPAAHGMKPAMFGGVLDGVMGVSLEGAAGLVNPMWTLQDAAGNHVGRQFAVRFAPNEFSGEVLLNVPEAGYRLVHLPKTPAVAARRPRHEVPEAGDARTAAERYASYHASYDARPAGFLAAGSAPGAALTTGGVRASYESRPVGFFDAGSARGAATGAATIASRIPAASATPGALPLSLLPAAAPAAASAPASWNPRAVETCLAAAGVPKTCAPAMFDSGSPNFVLEVPGAAPGPWPSGRTLEVGVPQAAWNATYTSGPGTGVTVTDAPSTATGGTLLGLPAFARGPIRFDLVAGTIGFPGQAPLGRSAVQAAPAPAPAAAAPLQGGHPAPSHSTPKKPEPRLPFHKTAKKAARLPDTGVPMSAALGVVTAMTALLAGIGTILAARRRTDHEA